MAQMIFVNLPVKDLDAAKGFWTELGYSFNPQFTDENAACLVFSDTIFAMLLTEPFFKNFTKKDVVDASSGTEAIIALSADSREEVDALVDKALAAGATPANEPQEFGDAMYSRSFQDLDHHIWEVVWMDVEKMAGEQGAAAQG
ncbi:MULTISPECIES: VOC family protein [Streptomyces]|uniref:Glyoxalase-like domain protein n=2 Tax=Streptomyces TaxID=1883 RepID=A0A1D8G034_9ACTN|nr:MULTISPECIES: VOC family protein [Streptomyces]AOT58766.1 Glyoxalase-like domain protein [Streptomyces rubrolavendulae]KAF0649720.1 glyoxalase [Streptomyces fradiae ATCC 10745 = DSM 40063]OSY52572.1 Glyoxalase-like domain protein [Streptomyces fradiae ATCC 10745 = DSM 40063]QEV12135.1 glyoxalase [Streptomyces fradiae ATCC 10745 = DSM 40063]UQS28294.1 VOC family protein [Streptomyces fradiae]